MLAKLDLVLLLSIILSAQALAQRVASDPLGEAEQIVEIAGPLPAAGKLAKLLATHELLMEPTAWYYHSSNNLGRSAYASYRFKLLRLYPDETFAYSETGGTGQYGTEYGDPSFFLKSGRGVAYSGKWEISDEGTIKFAIDEVDKFYLDHTSIWKREDFLIKGRVQSDEQYFGDRLGRAIPSEYDFKKAAFNPKVFGTTVREAWGQRRDTIKLR